MAFTIYRSTDASAPVMSGQNGTLVTLLDNCLVTGYGSKAAAGWTKPFTGASKAAFRAPSGNQLYLRVQDDGPGAGAAREARMTGYETMSDVDTGTGPFPTAAQGVGGIAMTVLRKSNTADATARTWIVIADARTLYVCILTADTAGAYRSFMFGEIFSILSTTDNYRTMIIGRGIENSTAGNQENLDALTTSVSSSVTNHYIARGYTGLGGSTLIGKHADSAKNGNSTLINGLVPLTNPSDGGMLMSPVWVHDPVTSPAGNLRGRMRGFWQLCHPATSVGDQEIVTGTGELAGRQFMFIKNTANTNSFVFEISDTLETN